MLGSADLLFVRSDLLPESAELTPPKRRRVPAVRRKLLGGPFHITVKEALSKPTAENAVHPAWTSGCLGKAMSALSDDEDVIRELAWG